MSIDFNKIAQTWFEEIGTIDADRNNAYHVETLRRILSEHIDDEILLGFVMKAFVNPERSRNDDYYDMYYDYGENEIDHYVSESSNDIKFNLNEQ